MSKERGAVVLGVAAGPSHGPASAARLRPWQLAAVSAAALLAVLCVRNRFLFTTRLYEDADMGANSILVEQARRFTLLTGNYSRDHFHHPGPAYLYVKAAGESLFWAWLHVVPAAWNGQLLAVYALNAVFAALAVGMVCGWTRSLRGAAACLAAVAALAAAHPAVLSSDWMPYLYVMAYTTFLIAAAGVAAGAGRDAWVLALTGCFLIHGHVCFLFFVPVICLTASVAALWPWRRSVGAALRSFFTTQRRVWVPAAAIGAAFAVPVVANLMLHWPGPFGDYLAYMSSRKAGGHSLAAATRDALWYWWPHRNAWAVPVAGYTAAAAISRWLAPVPLRRFLVALLAVDAVSSLAFLYYAATGIDKISQHYIGYFYWSAPVIVLLVIMLGLVEALPLRLGPATALGAATLACAALAVAPETHTSTSSSDPAVLSSGPDTDPALPGTVAALATRAGGRMIVLRFDYHSWPDVTGFLVQAERTRVRACVADPASALVVTSQFICTRSAIADGRSYWLTPVAPRGHAVIERLRQAVVTAGPLARLPGPPGRLHPAARRRALIRPFPLAALRGGHRRNPGFRRLPARRSGPGSPNGVLTWFCHVCGAESKRRT